MSKKLFILFLVTALLTSEVYAQRVISDDFLKKYYSNQRQKNRFKFYNKNNIAMLNALKTLPVDTNTVYVSSYFFSYQNDTCYSYTRFFSNGEVFLSHEYKSMPTEQECNDLTYGKWGMYTLKGNDLVIEIHVHGFPSRYWYNHIKIEGDTLKYYKRVIGKWNKQTEIMNFVEEKKQVKLTNFTINWK